VGAVLASKNIVNLGLTAEQKSVIGRLIPATKSTQNSPIGQPLPALR